jgi:hypothetical protein
VVEPANSARCPSPQLMVPSAPETENRTV